MHRVVRGLKWAIEGAGPGWGAQRRRGRKAAGLRYERALGEVLPPVFRHGVWFQFGDDNGMGWCQPDYFAVGRDRVLVLECKYTWVEEGHSQIAKLYSPVLEWIYSKPVLGVVVCRALTPKAPKVQADLRSAVEMARAGRPAVVQWFERTQLMGV